MNAHRHLLLAISYPPRWCRNATANLSFCSLCGSLHPDDVPLVIPAQALQYHAGLPHKVGLGKLGWFCLAHLLDATPAQVARIETALRYRFTLDASGDVVSYVPLVWRTDWQ
jgi:hypothetical protein